MNTPTSAPEPTRPPLLPSESPRRATAWLIGGIIVVLLLIVGILGYFVFASSNASTPTPSASATPLPTDAFAPTQTPLPTSSASPSPSPSVAAATIEIRNGTHIAGLAQKIKDKLTGEQFTVTTIGNAADKTLTKTMVYDLTVADADIAQKIAKELSAGSDTSLPKGEATTSADILIILGTDAATIK